MTNMLTNQIPVISFSTNVLKIAQWASKKLTWKVLFLGIESYCVLVENDGQMSQLQQ